MPRAVCPRCERPAATCLCATLPPPVAVRTGLVVLQHPAEATLADVPPQILRDVARVNSLYF